jgi:hypothetical protein
MTWSMTWLARHGVPPRYPESAAVGGHDWVHSGFGRAASPQNQSHHRITRTVVPQHLSALVGKVQHALERLRRVS